MEQPLYMLIYNWTGDWHEPSCCKFTYHARDDRDADNKSFGWARYHSFDARDVKYRLATPEEASLASWIHDEWVS